MLPSPFCLPRDSHASFYSRPCASLLRKSPTSLQAVSSSPSHMTRALTATRDSAASFSPESRCLSPLSFSFRHFHCDPLAGQDPFRNTVFFPALRGRALSLSFSCLGRRPFQFLSDVCGAFPRRPYSRTPLLFAFFCDGRILFSSSSAASVRCCPGAILMTSRTILPLPPYPVLFSPGEEMS